MDMSQNANMSIGCNVTECRHHAGNNYCSLEQISVVKAENATNALSKEITDCGSFATK